MINRRIAALAISGAILGLVTGTKKEWITVAHTGINRNGRTYTAEVLERMASQCKGIMVARAGDAEPVSMDDLLGIVSDVRTINGRIEIQVRWFSYVTVPIGQFISPWGVGTVGEDTLVGNDYKLESMRVFETTAFQQNTAVVHG